MTQLYLRFDFRWFPERPPKSVRFPEPLDCNQIYIWRRRLSSRSWTRWISIKLAERCFAPKHRSRRSRGLASRPAPCNRPFSKSTDLDRHLVPGTGRTRAHFGVGAHTQQTGAAWVTYTQQTTGRPARALSASSWMPPLSLYASLTSHKVLRSHDHLSCTK